MKINIFKFLALTRTLVLDFEGEKKQTKPKQSTIRSFFHAFGHKTESMTIKSILF